MFTVGDLSFDFINHTIRQGIKITKGEINFLPEDSDAVRLYFAGRTLFIDVGDDLGNKDAFTLCYADEDIGLFSGGRRRLMPIETLRLMEELMSLCNIKHDKKEWL